MSLLIDDDGGRIEIDEAVETWAVAVRVGFRGFSKVHSDHQFTIPTYILTGEE